MKIEVETAPELDACLLELSEATGKPIPILAKNCLEAEMLGQLAFIRRKRINRFKAPQKEKSLDISKPPMTGESEIRSHSEA